LSTQTAQGPAGLAQITAHCMPFHCACQISIYGQFKPEDVAVEAGQREGSGKTNEALAICPNSVKQHRVAVKGHRVAD